MKDKDFHSPKNASSLELNVPNTISCMNKRRLQSPHSNFRKKLLLSKRSIKDNGASDSFEKLNGKNGTELSYLHETTDHMKNHALDMIVTNPCTESLQTANQAPQDVASSTSKDIHKKFFSSQLKKNPSHLHEATIPIPVVSRYITHSTYNDDLAFGGFSLFSLERLQKTIWQRQIITSASSRCYTQNVIDYTRKPNEFCDYLECWPPKCSILNNTITVPLYLVKNAQSLNINDSVPYKSSFILKDSCLQVPLEKNHTIKQHSLLSNNLAASTSLHISALSGGREIWYQKYKPKGFLDLLTDESFNRNVLIWLNTFTSRTTPVSSHLDATKKAAVAEDWSSYLSTSSFPVQKMNTTAPEMKTISKNVQDQKLTKEFSPLLLICGPAGCGKSSAIRILTRHAGYDGVEVTASEYSSKELFLQTVKNVISLDAMTMTCFLSPDPTQVLHPRQKLLILDDIDEADQSLMDAFVSLVLTKDKTQQRSIVKRPVICICRDLYQRSLRTLRSQAQVLKLGPFTPSKLIKGLKRICDMENLRIDNEALHQLVAYTRSDLRLALNTLDYLSRTQHHQHHVTAQKIQLLWETYYSDRFYKHTEILSHIFTRSLKSLSGSFVLDSLVEDFLSQPMDHHILLTTLMENLHKVNYSDYSFSKTACLLDLMCEMDCFAQQKSLTPLVSISPLTFAYIYCGNEKGTEGSHSHFNKPLEPYPFTLAFKSSNLLRTKVGVKQALCHESLPRLRVSLASNTFALDLVYALVGLMTPSLIFDNSDDTWRQYHKLSVRPSAGITLHGVLPESMNRFHQLLELLITYSVKYSKKEPCDPLHASFSTKKSFHFNKKNFVVTPEESATNIFQLDPPIHYFLQNFCRNFYHDTRVSTPESSKILASLNHNQSKKPIVTQLAEGKPRSCFFSGYEYINLQLSRIHAEYLRKEIISFIESGVLPKTPTEKEIKPKFRCSGADTSLKKENSVVPKSKHFFTRDIQNVDQLLNHIKEKITRRMKYEQEHWNLKKEPTSALPLAIQRNQYIKLFDAEFRNHKPLRFKYDPGDARAVQYYPNLKDLLFFPRH